MKPIVLLIFVVIIAFVLFKKDTWQGFYYPDGCLSCQDKYIYSPIFNSKDECIAWANGIKARRNNSNDDFECGLNCKEKEGLNVCKETVDS